jgi:hypothetical protein
MTDIASPTSIRPRRSRAPAAPTARSVDHKPFPVTFQADDRVLLLTDVRVQRRNSDGTLTVVGSGINRTVAARDLMRIDTAEKGRGR